jgi:hypothetical protein
VREDGVLLHSHASRSGGNRFIPRSRFEETWNDLASGGAIEFRIGNHGSIVGAIFVQCLPRRVTQVDSKRIRLAST